MRKNTKADFHTSDLGRAKPKRHFIKTFVNGNLKQPRRFHSDTGMVMDRTSPAVVVRIILGLIVLHFIVIGGVMMRGNIAKSESGLAVTPTITPPPAAPSQAEPAQPAATPQAAPAQPAPADTQVHITQAPVNMEAVTPAPAQPAAPAQPVVVQPAPAPAPSASPTVERKHLVQSGDTWSSIATQYNVTEAVLKGANAQLASMTNLPGGTYLSVPVPADSAAPQPVQAEQPAVQEEVKYHTVKRGENLGRIARKYNIDLNDLYKVNNMTPADAKRLKIGQKLRVSK